MQASLARLLPPPGAFQRKPLGIVGLRLSPLARSMSCIGAFLPGAGIATSATAGPRSVIGGERVLWVGIGNTAAALASTPEGTGWKTVSGARQEAGSLLHAGLGATQRNGSIVARMNVTTTPLGDCINAALMRGTGAGGVGVGFNSSGFVKAFCLSDGGGLVSSCAGSTNWTNAGCVTLGVSGTNGLGNIALYENGVNVNTGSGSGGADSATSQALFYFGLYSDVLSGGNSLAGSVLWAFAFNRTLSDAEHFFVAKNPWDLLEPINSNLIGKAPAGGGTVTVTIDMFGNIEFSNTTKADLLSALEFEAMLKTDIVSSEDNQSTSIVGIHSNLEFQNSLAATVRAPIEFAVLEYAQVRSPIDWLATVYADARTRYDFGVNELTSIRSPVEFGVSELITARLPFEFETLLNATTRSPVEWGGVAQVVITGRAPIDWQSTLRADMRSPVETLAQLVADGLVRFDYGTGLIQTARAPLEFSVSERSDILSSIEWGGSGFVVAITGRAPIEWSATLKADVIASPATLATPQVSARGAIEYGATFASNYRGRLEWGQGLRADVLAPMAFLGSLYGQAHAPIEINGDLSGSRFGLNPHYLILPNGRSVLISPVARIYEIVPTRRTRGNT